MADPVRLLPRPRVLFVGAYARTSVRIAPNSGLAFDDLEFRVSADPSGGQVSVSRDRSFNPKRPTIMLLAGYEPGGYELLALKRGTSTVVGRTRFEVTAVWSEEDAGPPIWFTGEQSGFQQGFPAWGGGPGGPQNVNPTPVSGTRRIAILLVDTSSQRYSSDPATIQGHKDRWLNEVVNGVTQGGVTRSLRLFYQEVSYGNLDISAQVFGPVQLPDAWSTYFNTDGSPMGGYYQACFTAGDSLIDYTQFDTLLCVSQGVDATATDPAKSAWPYASIGSWGPFTTSDGNVNRGCISMPNEWGVVGDREIYDTLSHEFGHNLGLGDQYTPSVPGRNLGSWELMDWDDPLPHFSIAHRMMLGWVQSGWIQPFDFAASNAPVDQTITLHPIEQGPPSAGRRAGVEIRVADGLNYYFEYRVGQGMNIGDRALPEDSRVLGTDVASQPYSPPIARPGLLLLPDDADDDGPVLANGEFYHEVDQSDPLFPTDFRVDVSGIDGTKADVRIRYGVNGRPDPSIRPWPASADRPWQSPDIEIRNDRNAVDPAWFNVPWVNNQNTVVAKVRNAGSADAPQVRVNFFVKNYNVGGAPETFLGQDIKDVPSGATVEFQSSWVPPAEGHFCIIVRIPLYFVPTAPTVVEMTELNNVAQSNYDRFISATSSPPTREMTEVEVGNPYDDRTRVFLNAHQSNPMYRTYVGNRWLWLDPGETRMVPVMFEFVARRGEGDVKSGPFHPGAKEEKRFGKKPNDVGLFTAIEDPRDSPRHAIDIMSGAQVQVVTGAGTRFKDFRPTPSAARGTIVTVDDGKPVPGGSVIVAALRKPGAPETATYVRGKVTTGKFRVKMPTGWRAARAYFVPPRGLGDCETAEVAAGVHE